MAVVVVPISTAAAFIVGILVANFLPILDDDYYYGWLFFGVAAAGTLVGVWFDEQALKLFPYCMALYVLIGAAIIFVKVVIQ